MYICVGHTSLVCKLCIWGSGLLFFVTGQKYSQRWQYFQVVVKLIIRAHIIRVQIRQLRVALDAMLNWAKIPDN